MPIDLKRAYDPPAKSDGRRILVDRVWPRGIAKDDLQIDAWLKDLAPSTELRKWFGHDPAKWDEFRKCYARELEQRSEPLEELVEKPALATSRSSSAPRTPNIRTRSRSASISSAASDRELKEGTVQSWDEVRPWRREQRASLIARRQAIPQDERRRLQPLVLDLVEQHFPELAGALLGFYWPFRGEIGPHPLVRRLVERGARAALPVVVEKGQPLELWAWRPGAPLRRGVWDISIPVERQVVRPTALLVPLVGFDRRGYRLGYGGGYYDRTLATMDPKPLTIGVGYQLGQLESIHPQPHDIPLDAIVTETGVARFGSDRRPHGVLPEGGPFATIDEDPNSRATYASPPCFMHELDPSYLGLMPNRDDRSADEGPADPDTCNKTDAT